MLPQYDIDTSGPKRLVMLRIINADKSGYIFPDVIAHNYGINLEVLQSVLQDLVEQGHIEILLSPNRKLTHEERARKDDEQDYYFIKVNESFSDYYRQLEQTADFHNADREHERTTNDQPALQQPDSIKSIPKQIKVEPRSYDTANGVLQIGGLSVQIIKQPNQKGKLHESKEARTMRLVFDDVNSMKDGVPMRKILSVRATDFGSKHRKLAKSYVKEINNKIPEELGIKELLISSQYAVMVDSRYL